MIIVILPWAFYVNFHPRFDGMGHVTLDGAQPATPATQLGNQIRQPTSPVVPVVPVIPSTPTPPKTTVVATKKLEFPDLPVQGPIPTNGAVPLFGGTMLAV